MENLTLASKLTLNCGVEMPVLGLGTFQSETGKPTQDAVRWALEAGYRHIDTAAVYRNEQDVGIALRDAGIPREQVFLTTKIWNSSQGYETTLQAYDESLKRLGVEYIDLFLIHWPIKGTRQDTWRALVQLYHGGRCRAVGVSNYGIHHLEELFASSPLTPAVNQFEVSPFGAHQALCFFCQDKGIQVESYSPLARGRKLNDPVVSGLAHKYGKSPAQVLIRWGLEKGFVVIPKSVHRERIIENANVFDFSLGTEDMRLLDGLDENLRTINPPWMAGEWD